MYYFIPSWYGQQQKWHAADAPWYRADNAYEFDDTVNQVRMFRQAGEDTELITLGYAPQLRYFLHRQSIYPMLVASVFDRMQNVPDLKPGMFNYLDLPWPGLIEWVYTPYTVLAFLHGHRYARIEFGEDGNLLWLDYFDSTEQLQYRDYYDDRGFLSSREHFGRFQEYFDPAGNRQLTEDLQTGRVTIDPAAAYAFHQRNYGSMDAVIGEILSGIMTRIPVDAPVIVAADARHNPLIWQAVQGQRVVMSYFENRFDLSDTEGLRRDVGRARFVVTDTGGTAKQIRAATGRETNIEDISPFDTRLSLGKSQRIRELKIFMPVDGFTGVFLEKALVQVFDYMQKNPKVLLLIGTKEADEEQIEATRGKVQAVLDQHGYADLSFGQRIFMQPFLSENDLISILQSTRLILDVRDQPDLYLQIAGISAGIPQVNYRFTRYVDHQKDGYIIQNINYITEALEYYLSGLSHWNEALMYCVKKTESYTGGSLVQQWKEKLESER